MYLVIPASRTSCWPPVRRSPRKERFEPCAREVALWEVSARAAGDQSGVVVGGGLVLGEGVFEEGEEVFGVLVYGIWMRNQACEIQRDSLRINTGYCLIGAGSAP
jgi:hypothetical protein